MSHFEIRVDPNGSVGLGEVSTPNDLVIEREGTPFMTFPASGDWLELETPANPLSFTDNSKELPHVNDY